MRLTRVNDDPYPDKTPSHILSREYLILEESMSLADQKVFYPHQLLLSKNTISTYLKRFRYFRADMRMRIELISSPVQYGNIFVSMLPYQKGSTNYLSATQQSQASLHNLDVGLQQALDLRLPYLSPKLYWDLAQLDHPAWRVVVRCDTLDALTAAAPSNVRVKVFASFLEPEAAGYRQAVDEPAQLQSRTMDRRTLFTLPERAGTLARTASAMGASAARNLVEMTRENPAMSAAGVAAGTATAAKLANEAIKFKKNVESKPEKTKLDVCCDLSAPSGSNTSSLLGDAEVRDYTHLPPEPALSLSELISSPTLVFQDQLAYGTVKNLLVDPFELGTYCGYISRMYKHYRGSQQLLFRFVTAPSISTRIQITLYPTDLPGPDDVDTEGDLPTKIVTIRGTTSVTFDVPYLSVQPWTSTSSPYKPALRITMLDPMIQQYDKEPKLYMDIYQRSAPDFCFSGLQSFVPQNAVLQSSPESEFESFSARLTHRYPYQGSDLAVGKVLNRFSSRDPEPQLLFPFPIKIGDWDDAWKLDNFDYLSNLYAFYTGDTMVKMLFSKGTASGLLRVCVGNSKTHGGSKNTSWKSSNSMTLTDQNVWPILEYEYPYENEFEYDSIWYPNSMYPQNVDQTAELETYFISASEEFRLFYRLPLPSFGLTEPTEPDAPAVLQSAQPRLVGTFTYTGRINVPLGSTVNNTNVWPTNFPWDKFFHARLDYSVVRTAGDTDFNFFVGAGNSLVSATTGAPTLQPALAKQDYWIDVTLSGRNVCRGYIEGSFSNLYAPGNLWVSTAIVSATVGYSLFYTLTLHPWASSAVLVSPQHTSDTLGLVTNPSALPLTTVTSATTSVNVVNSPTVSISNAPLPVTVSGTPTVTVSNMPSEPIDVVLTNSSLPITGSVRVQGSTDPDTPVWTSLYRP